MSKPKTKGKRISIQEQLDMWVAGESIHNATRDECCPDFSCCRPELQAPEAERRKFAQASQSERNSMLLAFLGKSLRNAGMRVTTSADLRG